MKAHNDPPSPRRRRPSRRHAQVHLAPLDPDQAVALVVALENVIRAVWRAHGDAMADHQARISGDQPRPPGAEWDSYTANPTQIDDEVPF
jgi:hypothetical protein